MSEYLSPPPYLPIAPRTLAEAGLSTSQICDMMLRLLYLQGSLTTAEIAGQLRLPADLIEDPLRLLCNDKCLATVGGKVHGGDVHGEATGAVRFQMSDLGRSRARDAFEQCRYVGPAPVKLSEYAESCHRQSIGADCCSEEALRAAADDLVISDSLFGELGPAVCGGRSIYLHGRAGNGKTKIAKAIGRMLHESGGEIVVPYAIQAEGEIITIFDPTIHRPSESDHAHDHPAANCDDDVNGEPYIEDRRWRRVRRPFVVTGGELTLDMLDLRHNTRSNFYHAPMHIKANGGLFLMDDFGRQIARPHELLNRWVLPLEEKQDTLTLANGKKITVPFKPLTVFSSNLSPNDLRDDAFQRRIRHQIEIKHPDRTQFTAIFVAESESRRLPIDVADIEALFNRYYGSAFVCSEIDTRTPRASDARDLIDMCESIAGYRRQPVVLTAELLEDAAKRFFADAVKSAA